MGTLVAKTKGRNGNYFKVLQGGDFFQMPEEMEEHEYEEGYLLEDNEWHRISNFSKKDYCPQILTEQFNSAEHDQLTVGAYDQIDHFFEYQRGIYFFQKVSGSMLLRKNYLQISQAPKILRNRRLITLDVVPSALYIKKRDVLLFKNLFSLESMFRGIMELYREATQEEVETFLDNNFIELADGYSAEHVKRANRKRISGAMEILSKMKKKDRRDMFNYVQEYCPKLPLNNDEDAFQVSNETELKYLCYGIEERFYTTQRSREKRLANSVTNNW